MLGRFFKKKKSVELVLNTDEINCISLILSKELDRLREIADSKTSYDFTRRYFKKLVGKKVAILKFTTEKSGDLMLLTVLLMCEADRVEDQKEKDYYNLIAARIQWVHRQLAYVFSDED